MDGETEGNPNQKSPFLANPPLRSWSLLSQSSQAWSERFMPGYLNPCWQRSPSLIGGQQKRSTKKPTNPKPRGSSLAWPRLRQRDHSSNLVFVSLYSFEEGPPNWISFRSHKAGPPQLNCLVHHCVPKGYLHCA